MQGWFALDTDASGASRKVARLPFEFDSDFDLFSPRGQVYRVALAVPLCGSAGLWSPSCIASAQLAVKELNDANGLDGRQVELIMIDAAEEAPRPVEDVLNDLIEADAIDAIVGMHLSSVRQRIARMLGQRVPFVYTPLYEGGENTPGVFAIGETPSFQLSPALDFISQTYRPKRWAIIGNDYVWPRLSNSFSKQKIRKLGGDLVYERYVPTGTRDLSSFLQDLEMARPEIVLMSLIGEEAVRFNRLFGRMGLHQKMVRMSSALEENGLLASGAGGLRRLYSSSSYFGGLHTEANAAFREKYYTLHGENAPQLNMMGQSIYEGVQFLASMLEKYNDSWRQLSLREAFSLPYKSARWQQCKNNRFRTVPIYIARTDDVRFDVIKQL